MKSRRQARILALKNAVSHAEVADRAQKLAAAWLPLADDGPSLWRAGARYLRSRVPSLALTCSLPHSPALSLALAAEAPSSMRSRTAPPSLSARSTVPLSPPSRPQLRHIPLYLLDLVAAPDELR